MRERDYSIRTAAPADLGAARAVMLDTVYRDFGTGY
ncbi:GNAT family N-acetyltransferase, partial [Streptomyces sp. 4F]